MANQTGTITVCGFQMSGVEWAQTLVTDIVQKSSHAGQFHTTSPCVNCRPADCQLETFMPGNKIIIVVRHPKDVAVASYVKNGYQSTIDFGEFLSHFILNLDTLNVSWAEFHLQWDSAVRQMGPERVHILYYDDLVRDLRGEAEKVCNFLNITLDTHHLQQSVFTYSFDNFFTCGEPERKRRKIEHADGRNDPTLFEMNLWKTRFTVRQNDEFNTSFSRAFEYSNTIYDIVKLK